MEIFQVFVTMFSKSSATELMYVGKGFESPFPKYIKIAADAFENIWKKCIKVVKKSLEMRTPFPSYDNSAADDFEHILS